MDTMCYVFRRMKNRPGFSGMIILSIALAAGINLGIFSVARFVLLNNIGVPDEHDLVRYTLADGEYKLAFSGQDYDIFRELAALKNVLAWKSDEFRMSTEGGPVRVSGALVTGNTFTTLKISPYLGRLLNDGDDLPSGGKEGWSAVISYSLWKNYFGANPNIVGRNIVVDGIPAHVAGVLPPQFTGIMPLHPADLVLPHHFQEARDPDEKRFSQPYYFEWTILGRLPKGVSLQELQANLTTIEPEFRKMTDPQGLFSDVPSGALISVERGTSGLASSLKGLRGPVVTMEILSASVLFYCFCNIALLLWGRAQRDSYTTAIKIALGAQARDHMAVALLESTILLAFGCIIALPLAWGASYILSILIQSVHGFEKFPIISPAIPLVFSTIAITILLVMSTSLVISRWDWKRHKTIRLQAGRGDLRHTSINWMVGFEVFAAVVLFTTSVLSILGFSKLTNLPSGFGLGNTVLASLGIKGNSSGYGPNQGQLGRILDFIKASPGVQSVATINVPPLTNASAKGTVEVQGRTIQIWPAEVSPGYFSASGTRLLRGNDFLTRDVKSEPVCVLSRYAAAILFPGEDALGKYVFITGSKPCHVTGIAEDTHFKSMSDPPDAIVYRLGTTQMPNILVKAKTSALAIQAVQNAIRAIAPEALPARIDTIQTYIEDDLRKWKILTLSGIFCAVLAGTILSIGVFGVLSLQLNERKREFAIQIAIGASPRHICRSAFRSLRRPILAGWLPGSALALLGAVKLGGLYLLNTSYVLQAYCFGLLLVFAVLISGAFVPLMEMLRVSPRECLASE